MSQDLQDWLTLFSVPGLGPAAFAALLQRFHTPGEVLRAPSHRLCAVPTIGPGTARAVREKRDEAWAADQIARARDAGIEILTLSDRRYPPLLRQIYAPPPVLFALGDIEICAGPTVAIVGSRAFTLYGRDTAYWLAGELARRGITVASGMAIGIDTYAHRGALRRNGRTVAVLGSGLDDPYPPENVGLFRRICEAGAVVSEFPLGAAPEPHNFPRRNRIISGLSLGVLVVEAGDRSGALLTAQHALEQDREVFAVPGPVNSGKSIGTNRLIKQGAVLVRDVDDILQEISGSLEHTPDLPASDHPEPAQADSDGELPDEERAVLACLSAETPVHVDDIAAHTGLPISQALSVLLILELTNRVEQRPGKQFIRIPAPDTAQWPSGGRGPTGRHT